MNEIFEFIKTNYPQFQFVIIFIAALAGIFNLLERIINNPRIFRSRIDKLKIIDECFNQSKNVHTDEMLQLGFREIRANILAREILGINASETLRTEILSFYLRHKNEIDWDVIKEASPHLVLNQNALNIQFRKDQTFLYILYYIVAVTSFIAVIRNLLVLIIFHPSNKYYVITLLIVTLLLLLSMCFALIPTIRQRCALRIKKILESEKK